jgi:Protein of unknown function (DUF742)
MEDDFEDDDGLLDESFVRPFIITGGRGQSNLPIEAMVLSVANPRNVPPDPEYRAIMKVCAQAQSIAEISARCKLPLGVVRVLVSDLVMAGALELATNEKLAVEDQIDLIERIIAAVERI